MHTYVCLCYYNLYEKLKIVFQCKSSIWWWNLGGYKRRYCPNPTCFIQFNCNSKWAKGLYQLYFDYESMTRFGLLFQTQNSLWLYFAVSKNLMKFIIAKCVYYYCFKSICYRVKDCLSGIREVNVQYSFQLTDRCYLE